MHGLRQAHVRVEQHASRSDVLGGAQYQQRCLSRARDLMAGGRFPLILNCRSRDGLNCLLHQFSLLAIGSRLRRSPETFLLLAVE